MKEIKEQLETKNNWYFEHNENVNIIIDLLCYDFSDF